MTHHVYKVVELVGSSPEGITQAVEAAIEKAAASLRQSALVRGDRDPRADRKRQGSLLSGHS